jgi:transposase
MEQPQSPAAEPEFGALVAIDWADQQHYWCLRVPGTNSIERGTLDHTPEAVEAWAAGLSQSYGGRPIAVALEQRKGALAVMLGKYQQHLHLYPVHPLTLARYRQAWYPSGSKDDPKDADLLLEVVTQHRERLRRLDPDTTEMRLLQFQTENRRKLVDERTALSNRLKDLLKIYYAQIPRWFPDLTTAQVGDLLEKWPTLEELQKAKPATLERFFLQHGQRDQEKIQQRLSEIRNARPATLDPAVIGGARPMVLAWVRQMAVLRQAIRELDQAIGELARQQEDWAIFDALPGAGDVMAPRLMAAMGTRRERYSSASDVQCMTGIAPVKEASGNSVWIHFRWACPKFLRQTFHEWAACSIPHCKWAAAYYAAMKAKHKDHHVIVRALAFKWIRILFRCWKDRQPYREEVYCASVAKRNLPTAALARSVQMP